MAVRQLTKREESFVQAILRLGDDKKLDAYRASDYSQKLSTPAMSAQAHKLYNKPIINLRIRELQGKAVEIADKKFTISVEERLRRLDAIYKAGIEKYLTQTGERYENLAAAKGSIETMNAMLGTSESSGVKPVKVQIGVIDAS